MPDPKTIKLLLVEDDLEEEQLLNEAFIEIEENRQWCNWRASSIVHVERLAEALQCLRQEPFDLVLLNLNLPDSPALLDSFVEVNAEARGAPVVVLADEPDENLANRLLREGAQDILVKRELECAPLARAIRYAIERQRRANAVRLSAFDDDLTGTLTRDAFLRLARRYLQLPGSLSTREGGTELVVAFVEVSDDREARDPLLIRAGEILRAAFEPSTLIGRWDRFSFCVLTMGLTSATVEALLHHAAARIGGASVRFSLVPLDPREDFEELLAGLLVSQARPQAKKAILAD